MSKFQEIKDGLASKCLKFSEFFDNEVDVFDYSFIDNKILVIYKLPEDDHFFREWYCFWYENGNRKNEYYTEDGDKKEKNVHGIIMEINKMKQIIKMGNKMGKNMIGIMMENYIANGIIKMENLMENNIHGTMMEKYLANIIIKMENLMENNTHGRKMEN